MTISQIHLYNLLRERLGEQEAQALTEYVSSQAQQEVVERLQPIQKDIDRKADQGDMKAEFASIRLEIAELRGEMKENTSNLRSEILKSKASLLMWIVPMWLTTMLALLGSLWFKH